MTASSRFFHYIEEFFVLFAWPFESPKSEFVWRFYGQNSDSYSTRKLWLSWSSCDGSTLVSSRAIILSDVVTLYHLTPSGCILTPSPRRARVSWWPSWRRPSLILQNPFWPIKAWRRHVPAWRRHRYYSSRFWHFVDFFTFMLQKRPKCFLFQISSQKYLKWQKERFRVIIDQINTE